MNAMAVSAVIDGPATFSKQFNVSRETVAKLVTYADLLKHWQKTINLVSPTTIDGLWSRHMADSAQLLALAPADAKVWVDLGSGAGFPGLVLAILLSEREGIRMTLVESDARKVAFLREVVRQTGLNKGAVRAGQASACAVDICHARIEIASTHATVGTVDVVTARALAPLPKLLSLCRPFFGPRTVGLLLKGREAEREVEEAKQNWQFDASLVPSLTGNDARIAVVTKLGDAKSG